VLIPLPTIGISSAYVLRCGHYAFADAAVTLGLIAAASAPVPFRVACSVCTREADELRWAVLEQIVMRGVA
jgi:hypothetical protein